MANAFSANSLPSPEPPAVIGPPLNDSVFIGSVIIEICRGTPPWMISLIVHLVGLIVLALLVIKDPLSIETMLIAYQTAPGEVEELFAPEPVKIAAVESLHRDALTASSSRSGSGGSFAQAADVPIDDVPIGFNPDEVINLSAVDDMPSVATLFYAVPIKRQRLQQRENGKSTANERDLRLAEAAERGDSAFGEQLDDQTVYRFILWDIGRLSGPEGVQARQAFDGLTVDALPALIRGLNASAYIQASCPVIVLSSKIESLVTQSQDPDKYRYAQENIGQGVDPNARYATYLISLRQRLAQHAAGGGPVADGFQEQQNQQRRAEYVRHLTRARVAQLRKALENEDPNLRWAAAQVIAARGILIPEQVIPLLDDDELLVREQAHVTLVRLARGDDLGPEPGATEEEVVEAMDAWRTWWRQNRNRPGVSEYRPEELESEKGANAAK